MTFAKKLYLLLAASTFGMVLLGIISFTQIETVFESANYANVNSLPSLEQIDHVNSALFRMRISTWKHIAAGTSVEKNQYAREISAADGKAREALARYQKEYLSDEQDRELLQSVTKTLADYYVARDQVLRLSSSGESEQARKQQMEIQDVILHVDQAVSALRAYNMKLAGDGAVDAKTARDKAAYLAIIATLIFSTAIGFAGKILVGKLVNALHEAILLAEAVAEGNLTREERKTSSDEIGKLIAAFNRMNEKLNLVIGEVQRGANSIQTASQEIASGNMDLSGRTEQQAGTLEETAASLEELTSTVQHNTENTSQARRLADDAARTAVQGGQVVAQVVETMAAINASSVRIVDIISVIDSIAFQTNILALNAAVEAARAGEQGRGFAVVATEVRNLAQRSASAAKEIKMLIDDSVAQVNQGGELVNKAGLAMENLVTGVDRVARIIGEIADAGIQQSAGLQQVNQAVGEMDSFTQQNAALVEQSAAAATAMSEQALSLNQLIGQFVLRSESREAHVIPTARLKAAPTSITYAPLVNK